MPENIRQPLLDILSSDLSPDEFKAALSAHGKTIDVSKYRREIAEALIAATGICDAVPEAYKDFRDVVYDGALFILTGISQTRLLRIINGQFLTGTDASAGERLIALVRDIPMLYKLGQIMARNPHIEDSFRRWLISLEGGLIHIDIDTIKDIVEKEIGSALAAHAVEIAGSVMSEASVSSVVSFQWRENALVSTGVFKVIKPDIPGFLAGDLKLLEELAAFYTKNRDNYAIRDFNFIDTFDDVKYALSKEADLRHEQHHMTLAREFYRDNPRIIVPRPLPFSTAKVTAMEFIDGEKITSAKQKTCAEELFNALVSSCIFSAAEDAIFHGDPHAGNIIVVKDAQMGFRIALIDWSQAGSLTKAVRAAVLKLAAGIITNNHSVILDSINALAEGGSGATAALSKIITNNAPAGMITGVLNLLDRLALRGITFPADLLLFRKAFFTLNGVILSLDPEFNHDACLMNYMLKLMADEMPARWINSFFPYADSPFNYRSLVSNADLFMFGIKLFYNPPL